MPKPSAGFTSRNMPFHEILAKIAKGPKASKDLTWDECKQSMKALVEGEATPAQVGAFLIAMRFKMESVTELAGLTAAARQYVPPLAVSRESAVVDVPTYAGKQDTFHAIVAASIVATAAGATVLMHGYDGIPGRPGAAGVLKALGIRVDAEPKQVAEEVNRNRFAYLDIGLYHPPIYRFLEMRQALGVRNVFHPIARLLNPARAKVQVVGLSHPLILKRQPKPYVSLAVPMPWLCGESRGILSCRLRWQREYWNCERSESLRSVWRQRISACPLLPPARWQDFSRTSGRRKQIFFVEYCRIVCKVAKRTGC